MEQQSDVFEKMTGFLEDRFDFLNAVAGTLTAEAYRALDLTTNQEVTVWRTRGPLQEAEVGRFQRRLLMLQGIPRVEPIIRCGVDCHNRGFAVLRAYDGRKVNCIAASRQEIEQRIDDCAAIVGAIHDLGIACGDICLDSFLLKDRGGVTLFAVLGDCALQFEEGDSECNRNRYQPFRPPEQRKGGLQNRSVDLYALARLAETLGAVMIQGECSQVMRPPMSMKGLCESTSTEELRKKNDSVRMVGRARDEASDTRTLEDLKELRDAAENRPSDPSVDQTRGPKDRECNSEGRAPQSPAGQGTFGGPGGGGISLRSLVSLWSLVSPDRLFAASLSFVALFQNLSRVLILALLNIIGIAVLFFSYVEGRSASIGGELAVVDVKQQRDGMIKFSALYESHSPSAYKELREMLSATVDPERRREILRVLTFRARRDGLGRTSDVVLDLLAEGQELGTFGKEEQSPPLVLILDPALSSSGRVEVLAQLYQSSPRLATVLAASSALDTGDAEAYRGLLAKAVVDQTGMSNGGEHNPYALMVLLPDVHDLFSEDIVELRHKIPAADVAWLIDELGQQGRSEVSTGAKIAERRNIFTGAHTVFLAELRRSAALKQSVRSSLASGALGKPSIDDVRRFNEWSAQGAVRVLEATILTTSSSSLRQASFDSLSAKPTADPYLARVIEFVRTSYGDDSYRFAGVVAAIDLRDVVGQEVVHREFEALRDAPRSRELLRALVQGASPDVIQIVLTRYGDSMEELDIVDLLGHPSQAVRVMAVSSLSKVNDIMLLKLISQSYDDESDPQVRAVYEEKISLIKERRS
ncbi:MAG: Protein kinase domain [Pseudomonadota bacterium]|jgi:hypothetical protein